MDLTSPTKSNDGHDEMRVQAILAEYDKLRDEMMHYINLSTQIPLYALGSISIIIPLLLSQTPGTLFPQTVAALLYAVVIVFSAMGLVYASSAYNMYQISAYISRFIEPELSRITNETSARGVLRWESYVKERRRRVLER